MHSGDARNESEFYYGRPISQIISSYYFSQKLQSVFENFGKLSAIILKPFMPQPTMVFETGSGERQAP